MLAPLLAIVQLSYSFPADRPVLYDVNVHFEGYVQVFGGRDADVEAQMKVEAVGAAPDAEGNPRAVSEIKSLTMLMNGTPLPLEPKNITRYFPKTTISMTPQGKTLKTDAPDTKLPISLPALHPKRFPDITYLPLEFPVEGVELGKEFRFTKPFGDSNVEFSVTPETITEDAATLSIKMKQAYLQFEDKYGNAVEEKLGTAKVSTDVQGTGQATFDRKSGIVSKLNVVAIANSTATELASGKQSDRKLKTTLTVTALQEKL
ncbi:MAG: hypothetical protein ACAH95_12160 [Fimbriimonas sp.]